MLTNTYLLYYGYSILCHVRRVLYGTLGQSHNHFVHDKPNSPPIHFTSVTAASQNLEKQLDSVIKLVDLKPLCIH